MAEEEEEDYMSDAFLAQAAQQDVRPGLLRSEEEKRKHELLKKKREADAASRERFKPLRVREEERREEGLNRRIGEENKGFQLLQKMGYKPGTALGSGRSGEGQGPASAKREADPEPIPIKVKKDRSGVGVETQKEERKKEVAKAVRARKEALEQTVNPAEFRERARKAAMMKEMAREVEKARVVCKNLDMEEGIESPVEKWYWPLVKPKPTDMEKDDREQYANVVQDEEDEDEDEDELPEVPDMLQSITDYLRVRYYYCLWCGTRYDNAEDMDISCPGTTKDEH